MGFILCVIFLVVVAEQIIKITLRNCSLENASLNIKRLYWNVHLFQLLARPQNGQWRNIGINFPIPKTNVWFRICSECPLDLPQPCCLLLSAEVWRWAHKYLLRWWRNSVRSLVLRWWTAKRRCLPRVSMVILSLLWIGSERRVSPEPPAMRTESPWKVWLLWTETLPAESSLSLKLTVKLVSFYGLPECFTHLPLIYIASKL